MRTSIVTFACCLAFSAPLAAQTQSAEPAAPMQKTSAVTQAKPLICKPVYHEGMVIGRSCHTQEEWDRARYDAQKDFRDFQLNSLTSPMR